jgi:23S rRNA pseudouridine2605 synthase
MELMIKMKFKSPEQNPKLIRLNKFIAECGVTSRRKADEMILAGKVKVNDRIVVELGEKINPNTARVFVNQKQIIPLDEKIYVIFNKPKDCITTLKDERGRTTILDYIKVRQRIFPVGRLDRDTTGVLLLTNDGELTHVLTHPKNEIKKVYKVLIDKAITREHANQMSKGVLLSDGKTEPAEVYIYPGTKNKEIGIVIHEGRNRQVRRMFESFGYEVEKLDRLFYGPISYEGLKKGQWRYLTRKEISSLMKLKED